MYLLHPRTYSATRYIIETTTRWLIRLRVQVRHQVGGYGVGKDQALGLYCSTSLSHAPEVAEVGPESACGRKRDGVDDVCSGLANILVVHVVGGKLVISAIHQMDFDPPNAVTHHQGADRKACRHKVN